MPPMYQDPAGRWYELWKARLENCPPPYIFPWQEHPTYDEFWQQDCCQDYPGRASLMTKSRIPPVRLLETELTWWMPPAIPWHRFAALCRSSVWSAQAILRSAGHRT